MIDPDMEYVTRKELREELAPIRAQFAPIHAEFASIHTMLRHIVDVLTALQRDLPQQIRASDEAIRRDLAAQIRAGDEATRRDLAAQIRASDEATRTAIGADMRALFGVHAEQTRAWFATLDEKYRDLPARVTALEQSSKRRPARRRAAKRS